MTAKRIAIFLTVIFGVGNWCLAQAPARKRSPENASRFQPQIVNVKSRVIQRGDLEILTFETEGDFIELERRFDESQKATPEPGTLTTQYFRSSTDGSVQPYGLWLPQYYSPKEKYPLILQLHGIGPKQVTHWRLTWTGVKKESWIDPHTPHIFVSCFGRSNTFFRGMGEQDVFEVMAEARRRFSIDPDRVFISGFSMGGAGAFIVGLHYPDRFGSILAVDPALTSAAGARPGGGERDAPPAWSQPQRAIGLPANLDRNARNVPVYFKLAGAGQGARSETDRSQKIVEQGGFSTTELFPGMPHSFAYLHSFSTFIREAILKSIQRNPPQVKFYTNTLRYNRAYWVTVDQLEQHNADATVVATYDDGKPRKKRPFGRRNREVTPARPPSLKVETTNIEALTLRLAGAVVPEGAEVPVTIDGQEVLTGPLPAVAHLVKSSGKWRLANESGEAAQGKRHGVQGPIGDAFNSKFLVVYGQGDRKLAIVELDAVRDPGGRMTLHGDFPMKAASKTTDEDIANCNLILFGSVESNPIIQRLTPFLPEPLMRHTGEDRGVVFICPNPENPDRYVVVWTTRFLSVRDNGLQAGRSSLPINMLPDYVLIESGKVASAGHFDNNWNLTNVSENVDPNRIGSMGHSAGAHLAACLGVIPKEAGLDVGNDLDQSSVVNAVCSIATPTNMAGSRQSNRFRGDMELAKKVSPITYVNKDAPPYLLVHGSEDRTVPIELNAIGFIRALRDAGAKNANLAILDGLGHDPMPSIESFFWSMCLAFFDATIGVNPGQLAKQVALESEWRKLRRTEEGYTFDKIEHYDKNKDGKITRDEWGGTNEMFDRIDRGEDGVLSKEDLVREARRGAQRRRTGKRAK